MNAGLTIETIEISFLHVKNAAVLLRILTNPICQRILRLFEGQEALTVTGICIHLRLERNTPTNPL